MISTLLAVTLAGLSLPNAPQSAPVAFINATIYPISGPKIERGTVMVDGDKISQVGDSVAVPTGARVVDCAGMVLLPGLVDTHSHVGDGNGADSSGPIQPDARIYDAINVRSPEFRRALAGGITTLNIMPGSGHLMSGQTLYAKNRRARIVEDLFIRDTDGWIFGGLKMANGTNPIGEPPFPGTRGKAMALVREKFLEAQEYGEKWKAYEVKRAKGEKVDEPSRNIGLDAMVEALRGRRIVQHHTHRADDILSVLRLRDEFGLKVVLQHVSEGHLVAREIARANAPCSIIVLDSPGGKLEAVNVSRTCGGILERAGVNVALHTDDGITDSRLFLRTGAMAVRGGMSREGALRALTLSGAEMLGLEKRVGTLEPGKDADLVILSGDPFATKTRVLKTYVEGQLVFDYDRAEDRLYATGGPGAGTETKPYLCCQGDHH
jgi:imidazolonepropionase-like amidohydrolase